MIDKEAELALLSEVYVGAAAGALLDGPLGAAVGAAAPLAERGLEVLVRRVGQTERSAVKAAQMSPDELIDRLLRDERLISLTQRVYSGAQTAATEEKRVMLGRLLGNAARDVGTDIDAALLYAQILVELEAPHITVMWLLEQADSESPQVEVHPDGGISLGTIATHAGTYQVYSKALLTRLHGHALIEDPTTGTWNGIEQPGQRFVLTDFGRAFLGMVREPPVM